MLSHENKEYFDDVCGFRFWTNFLAVVRFWTILSLVLRFLIHPNAPLLIHSCNHCLKIVALKKNKFWSIDGSDLLAINVTTAFAILKSLEYKFLKGFYNQKVKAVILKILHPSNILDLE